MCVQKLCMSNILLLFYRLSLVLYSAGLGVKSVQVALSELCRGSLIVLCCVDKQIEQLYILHDQG